MKPLTPRQFALNRHGAENAYLPVHLERVVSRLERYLEGHLEQTTGPRVSALLAAGWCHDVLEDTPTTREDLESVIGPEATALVVAVTDEPGDSRRERKVATYPKTRAAGSDAVLLKLCDRIVNAREEKLRSMYQKEHAAFRAALYREGEHESLWAELEDTLAHK